MSDGDFWDVLGIAPTTDARTIRSAYARRLKQDDTDRDTEAFMALHAARERALAWAATFAGNADDDDMDAIAPPVARRGDGDDVAVNDHDTAITIIAASDEPQVADHDADLAAYEAHYQAIWALLFHGEDDNPSLRRRFLVHFEAILADHRMAAIDHYADAEIWFSEVLARSSPRSDPLLTPVAERFEWMNRADDVGQAPATAFVTRRLRMLAFHDAVRRPEHPLNPAWRELTTPADARSRRGRRAGATQVKELLGIVRNDFPALEDSFDWYRVSMWENRQTFSLPTGVWIAIAVGLLQLLRVIAADAPAPRTASPFPARLEASNLTTPEADIPEALTRVSGGLIDAGDIEARNPDLHRMLRDAWFDAQTHGRRKSQFAADLLTSLDTRFNRILGKASHENLSALVANRVEQARYYRASDPVHCDDMFRGRLSIMVKGPTALQEEARRIRYRILLETRGPAPERKGDGTYMIPGAVLDDSARRAGTSYDKLVAALHGKGTEKQRCDAEIALREATLRLPPKAGAKLLQHM